MTFHYNRDKDRKKRQELRNCPTKSEKVLWQYLRNRQVDGFKIRRQYSIDGFIIDFYCVQVKLAIEIDGDVHLTDGAKEYDEGREEHIRKYGVTFIRFRNDDVINDPDEVVSAIREKLHALKRLRENYR
ncbi:MAG: DUF559 domain-containing protein [Calditrichaeota bacterium]|nr:DUF559 domain-containing protein [Calditrichota bacterium]MCB0315699.1 DUF559 domain-containing protein [Calditrichota bacterium]